MSETFHTLLSQLQSLDVVQRSEAVLQLGELRETRAVDILVNVLCTDSDINVQEDAVWSLVRLGEPAIEPLLNALTHDNPHVRHNAAHALGKIADARALDALIPVTQDPDQSVRYKAVYALGQIGDARAISALIARLDDPVKDVRWAAREVLEGFGKLAIFPLIGALQAESIHTRELAAGLLGDLGDSQAAEPLIAALDTGDWQVRFAVVYALSQMDDCRVHTVLERLIGDADPRVRAIARIVVKGAASP